MGSATPELKQPKSSDESALEIAIKSVIIAKASLEQIKQVLRQAMVLIGLRGLNFPNEHEKGVLISYIIKNYGGNRIDEVPLAFEMAISGKLDINDTNCYENFSPAYFSKIMMAYQKWASQAVAQLKSKPPEQKIFTEEEMINSEREDVNRQYKLFLKNYELRGLELNKSVLIYDSLLNEGEGVLDFFKRKKTAGFKNIYAKS